MPIILTTGWLPLSDDVVGPGLGWGNALAGLQQLDFGCHRFAAGGRMGGAVGPRVQLRCWLGKGGRMLLR